MASSKDHEKIWENYQEVVKTKDVSIVDYCQRRSTLSLGSSKNGIVYSQFQRWYKKHISGVTIIPVEEYPSGHSVSPSPSSPPVASKLAKIHYACKRVLDPNDGDSLHAKRVNLSG